jgi:methylenetetrahydrofolate--tRNA-(uracil-5-)-methyltransferase
MKVAVIGAGLAGSECAWVLAEKYQLPVTLFEMKSKKMTPAQISPHLFAELVCSNSLKSKSRLNPAGTLKNEIEKLGSLVIPCAKETQVPAGEALAVDREIFSAQITEKLRSHKNITIVETVVESIGTVLEVEDFSAVVIATGPLTDDRLAENLKKITNSNDLYFYDAIAPIIDAQTIDHSVAFRANRLTKTHLFEKRRADELLSSSAEEVSSPAEEVSSPAEEVSSPAEEVSSRGLTAGSSPITMDSAVKPRDDSGQGPRDDIEGDYLNIPLNKEEYFSFVEKIQQAPKVPHHEFEKPRYFNGCQPIELLAERGPKTLAFGPMKPRGLTDPRTGKWPYAVIQLRKEKLGDFAWNMVGFQTRMTWTAQKEIFKTLPGLQDAEFFRMGSMHRNTYMISSQILNSNFSLKADDRFYLAGQIMGVEGYLESSAMGVWIGHVIGQKLKYARQLATPPKNTSLGCLAHYCLETEAKSFSPMNIHWGLFSDLSEEDLKKYADPKFVLPKKLDKSVRRELMACRSEDLFDQWYQGNFS